MLRTTTTALALALALAAPATAQEGIEIEAPEFGERGDDLDGEFGAEDDGPDFDAGDDFGGGGGGEAAVSAGPGEEADGETGRRVRRELRAAEESIEEAERALEPFGEDVLEDTGGALGRSGASGSGAGGD